MCDMANLTAKELTALDETLNSEQVLIKKFQTMAGQTTDSVIKSKLETIAGKHQQHYNELLNFLS